jgi:hypothetical protein
MKTDDSAKEDFLNRLGGEYPDFVQTINRRQSDKSQGDRWIRGVAEHYPSASELERDGIRAMFSDDEAQWYLLEAVDRLCQGDWSKDAHGELQVGLSILSIQDRSMDPRDFMVRAEMLYRKAQEVGLKPDGLFRQTAGFSSTDTSYFQQSTSELLYAIAARLGGPPMEP